MQVASAGVMLFGNDNINSSATCTNGGINFMIRIN
jgi:hypothetical protein